MASPYDWLSDLSQLRNSGARDMRAHTPSCEPPLAERHSSATGTAEYRGNAGHSEDPTVQALDSPFRGGPIALGPVHAWIAAVFRCLRRPYRSDQVSHRPSAFSSDSICGKSAPFQVGYLHPCGWPDPSDYWRAFASSHLLDPLGLGLPCGRLCRLIDNPWGLSCSTSRTCRRRRVSLCPGEGSNKAVLCSFRRCAWSE